jgi:hypothetical protein
MEQIEELLRKFYFGDISQVIGLVDLFRSGS